MKIIIPYNSKWSVSFTDKDKLNKASSLGAIQGRTEADKNKNILLDEFDTYETTMLKIKEIYGGFDYSPISESTVLGVLARLLGEVRYLDVALREPEHIINQLKDKVSFNVYERELYNEIIQITTPKKEVQNNGGGFISSSKSNFLLLSKNIYSEIIYSLFNIKNFEDIVNFIQFISKDVSIEEMQVYLQTKDFLYKDDIQIHNFIKEYNSHSKETGIYDKEFRDYQKEKIIINDSISHYISLVETIGLLNYNDKDKYFAPKYINIIGIMIYTVTNWLKRIGHSSQITGSLIRPAGNIEGIATLSGGLTVKDFYSRIAPKKYSYSTPYMFDTKYIKKQNAKQFNQFSSMLGVGKENGVLEISLDVNSEEAEILRERIYCVGVASFQLGKKGLAYVKEINTNE